MKKLIKKIILIVTLGVLVFYVSVWSSMYLVGSIKSVDAIHISNIKINDKEIKIETSVEDSFTAFRKYKYRIKDDKLYISVYYVVASDFYRSGQGKILIEGDFSSINNIYVEDKNQQQIVWSR